MHADLESNSPPYSIPPIARAICWTVACLWGTWVLLQFRTQDWGFRPRTAWLTSAMFVAPAAFVLTFRGRPKKWLGGAAAVIVLCLGTSEGLATLEEHLFERQARAMDSTEQVYSSRWWPFEHHGMIYDPLTETFAGHD